MRPPAVTDVPIGTHRDLVYCAGDSTSGPGRCVNTATRGLTGNEVPAVNESPTMDATAISVSEAATDAAEVARRLAAGLPVTDFDRERLARILDRLSEELAEAATDVRRAR